MYSISRAIGRTIQVINLLAISHVWRHHCHYCETTSDHKKLPLQEHGPATVHLLNTFQRDYLQFCSQGKGTLTNTKHFNIVIGQPFFWYLRYNYMNIWRTCTCMYLHKGWPIGSPYIAGDSYEVVETYGKEVPWAGPKTSSIHYWNGRRQSWLTFPSFVHGGFRWCTGSSCHNSSSPTRE